MQYLISGKRIGTTGGALLRICMTEVSWPGYLSHGLPNNEGANIFGRERGVVVMTLLTGASCACLQDNAATLQERCRRSSLIVSILETALLHFL